MNAGWRFALIDVLFILLLVLILLPHNPETESEAIPPGMVIVEIRWPDGLNIDVDLWVKAPGDAPVGYSRKAGAYFNLLRDDLGKARDYLELNYENAYSRGAPAGEYIVNVHLYIAHDAPPVEVAVRASVRNSGGTMPIFARRVVLKYVGQELTVARFSLDRGGFLVRGSIHDFPKALRNAMGEEP